MKLIILGLVMLLLFGGIGFYSISETKETETITQQDYTPKEIIYAPIECFLNETHYDIKCVEDNKW